MERTIEENRTMNESNRRHARCNDVNQGRKCHRKL